MLLCHRPNPSWDCFEGDAAYAGEYSHRPIPAGIAFVTLVTLTCHTSQTCSSESRYLPKGSKPLHSSFNVRDNQHATRHTTSTTAMLAWWLYAGERYTSVVTM